jgi:hypothetical protein
VRELTGLRKAVAALVPRCATALQMGERSKEERWAKIHAKKGAERVLLDPATRILF